RDAWNRAWRLRSPSPPPASKCAQRGIRHALLRPPRRLATIDHRERLWDRRSEIAATPFAIFPPKKNLEATSRGRRPAGSPIGTRARIRDAAFLPVSEPSGRPATSLGPRCTIAIRHRGKFPRKKLRLINRPVVSALWQTGH